MPNEEPIHILFKKYQLGDNSQKTEMNKQLLKRKTKSKKEGLHKEPIRI